MNTRRLYAAVGGGCIALAVAALTPATAFAQKTCDGFINIDYSGAGRCTDVGETVDMVISFGTGSILNGKSLTIDSFQLNLDCDESAGPLDLDCTDATKKIEYEGDGTIDSDCMTPDPADPTTFVPVTWTTGHPVGPDPNQVVFTAIPPLVIPADKATLPGYCSVTFTVKKLEDEIDPVTMAPEDIEQVIGYHQAACDNGVLISGGFQTSSIAPCVQPVDFACIEINKNISAAFKEHAKGVDLVDVFGHSTVDLGIGKRLCAPANKNGEDPAAAHAADHLAGYNFDVVDTTFPKNGVPGVHVESQLGSVTFDVTDAWLLLVPTAKSQTDPDVPPLADPKVPHFQCYRVDNVSGATPAPVDSEDQFTHQQLSFMDVGTDGKTLSFCASVNKNGEDSTAVTDPRFLMCYLTTTHDQRPGQKVRYYINNQFGPIKLGKADLKRYDEFCTQVTSIQGLP